MKASLLEDLLLEARQGVMKTKNPRARRVIYTANIGLYDAVRPAPINDPDVDTILFADKEMPMITGWKVVIVRSIYRSFQRTAKALKLLPHRFLHPYKESIWIDSNRVLLRNPYDETFLQEVEFSLFRHPKRNRVCEEAQECIKWRKSHPAIILSQLERYFARGFADDVGLWSGAFIVRRHNRNRIRQIMELWWSEVEVASVRDQLSLPYVIWLTGYYPLDIRGNVNRNCWFETRDHARPYASDRSPVGRLLSKSMFWVSRMRRWLSGS